MDRPDDGKRQAEQQAALAHEHPRTRPMQHTLSTLAQFFSTLAVEVNAGSCVTRRDFAVQGNARLRNLVQQGCVVHEQRTGAGDAKDLERVALHFRLTGEQPVDVDTYGDRATERLCRYLRAYGLRFEMHPCRNERGIAVMTTVRVLAEVPASVTAHADAAGRTVALRLRNVASIGDAEYRFDADELDRTVLEELGKMVRGEVNAFPTLGRHQALFQLRIVACPPAAATVGAKAAPARTAADAAPSRSY